MFGKGKPPPVSLSEAEARDAATHFLTAEPLCFARGHRSNDGFGAQVSFNSSTHVSAGGAGSIEIALRAAILEFHAPPDAIDWTWSDAVADLIRERRQKITLTESEGETASRSLERSSNADVSLGGGASAGVVKAEGGAKRAGGRIASLDLEKQRGQVRQSAGERDLIEMMVRSPHRFDLHFAPVSDSLVSLNPHLNRLSILSVPEPSAVEPTSVRICLQSMLSGYGGAVVHSLAIRNATGAWAELADGANKRIISEVLLSKFLRPLHRRRQLWPPIDDT